MRFKENDWSWWEKKIDMKENMGDDNSMEMKRSR